MKGLEDTQPWAWAWERRELGAPPAGVPTIAAGRWGWAAIAPLLLLRQQPETLAQPALSLHPHFKQGAPLSFTAFLER